MTEQTEHTTAQPGAVPTRIELEDLIEAVTRGVARALAAQDEVSGYAMQRPLTERPGGQAGGVIIRYPGTITIGLIYTPPSGGPFGGADRLGSPLAERQ